MKLRPERLAKLLEEVAHERLSLSAGSPSDAEIGRAKLSDLAVHYIPELVHEVQRLATTPPAPLADAALAELEALEQRATAGPWVINTNPKKWVGNNSSDAVWADNRDNDAAFVAAVRNALPCLLARVRAAEAKPDYKDPSVQRQLDLEATHRLFLRGLIGATKRDELRARIEKAFEATQTVKGGQPNA